MMVIDTSAIFANLYKEAQAAECQAALRRESKLVISAGTLVEAYVVAARSGYLEFLPKFLETLDLEVVPVVAETSVTAGRAYAHYGRGLHAASLNFGDTFAYVLAKERNCPLLFVGRDFSITDVIPALR